MRGRRTQVGVLVLAVVAALGLAGCTGSGSDATPTRVVVAVDRPFGSLNAATAAGRTPGSTLVRGLTHAGFVALDATGAAQPDTSFGEVTKVSDSPLTVRYTIADGVTWSDGVPVTGADLLLEWAARSGQLDEVVPTLAADGSIADPSALDSRVAFAATSPALVHASALPAYDAHSLTLVYDHPVADWQVALDVNLPAHVVGRLALGGGPTAPAASRTPATLGTASPSVSSSPSAGTTDWAAAVADAIVHGDRTRLVAISRVWRTGADAAALAKDPALAVSDGPYTVASVQAGRQVSLLPNLHYHGTHAARLTEVVVRSDLDALAQVNALKTGTVDVIAPVDTADVRTALKGVPSATVHAGGDAVLQLQVGEKNGGPFDPSSYPTDGAAKAAAARAAFLAAAPLDAMAAAAGTGRSGTVLATAGALYLPAAATGTATSTSAATVGAEAAATTVRLLVDADDPVRAAMAAALVRAERAAGFTVTTVTGDAGTALWSKASSWDVALVPVGQAELPVDSVLARWRSGGATNVTTHADPALDALLDSAGQQTDRTAAQATLARVAAALDGTAVAPVARQPVLVAVRDASRAGSAVTPIAWGSADLGAWWSWARR